MCKVVQTFKWLIFPFTCAFISLCTGIFPSHQMNPLINDVTFRSAVIRQITAAGPPFCDSRSFMCLHSRCLFMVCFWTIIGRGCFSTFYCYCTFLQFVPAQDLSYFRFLFQTKIFAVLYWYFLVTLRIVEKHNIRRALNFWNINWFAIINNKKSACAFIIFFNCSLCNRNWPQDYWWWF